MTHYLFLTMVQILGANWEMKWKSQNPYSYTIIYSNTSFFVFSVKSRKCGEIHLSLERQKWGRWGKSFRDGGTWGVISCVEGNVEERESLDMKTHLLIHSFYGRSTVSPNCRKMRHRHHVSS